jgi:hypothetical protein
MPWRHGLHSGIGGHVYTNNKIVSLGVTPISKNSIGVAQRHATPILLLFVNATEET